MYSGLPDVIGQLFLSRCSSGVECFLGKEEVTGSNPVIGSKANVNLSKFIGYTCVMHVLFIGY